MRRAVAAVVGIAISVIFGWLAIRGLNFHEVRTAIGDASPAWILAAVGVSVVGVTMRSERWRSLFPRDSRPGRGADVLGHPGRPAREQRAARSCRRARARARALARGGTAPHGGAGDGRRGARLRPGRDRGAGACGRLAPARCRRRAPLHAAGRGHPGRHGRDRGRARDRARTALRGQLAPAPPDAAGARRRA